MRVRLLSPVENWQPILDEAVEKAPFLVGKKDFIVTKYPVMNLSQEYRDGKYGLELNYLRVLTDNFNEDVIVVHAPNFVIRGAIGWINYNINDKVIIQLYDDHLREYSRTGEFRYRTTETLIHEFCHKYYRKFGLADKTHYYHYDKLRLLGAVEDIKKHLLKEKVGLMEQVVRLLRKLLSSEPDVAQVKQYYCLHHSATSRDFTRAEVIMHNSIKQYGKCFYDIIIDNDGVVTRVQDPLVKERGTTDICVIGSFDRETPTQAQIKAVKEIIKGNDWTTHRDLAKKGLASPSICPGNLTSYL